MKDNTKVVLIAEIGLAIVALDPFGNVDASIRAAAAGGLIGIVGGHLNGSGALATV